MNTKFFGRFSGWQVTVVVCTAILAPTGLFAAGALTNVSVVDATTKVPVNIDNGGRMAAYDGYALYRNYPRDFVDIRVPMATANGCQSATYAIPAGKALIITSVKGNFYNADGSTSSGFWIMGGTSCLGNYYLNEHAAVSAAVGAVAEKNYTFGTGLPIPAGSISFYSNNDTGWTVIQGYLVPASWVSTNSFQYASNAPLRPGSKHAPSASAAN